MLWRFVISFFWETGIPPASSSASFLLGFGRKGIRRTGQGKTKISRGMGHATKILVFPFSSRLARELNEQGVDYCVGEFLRIEKEAHALLGSGLHCGS